MAVQTLEWITGIHSAISARYKACNPRSTDLGEDPTYHSIWKAAQGECAIKDQRFVCWSCSLKASASKMLSLTDVLLHASSPSLLMTRPPGKDPARNGKGDAFGPQQYADMNHHLLRVMSSGLPAKATEEAIRFVTEQVSCSALPCPCCPALCSALRFVFTSHQPNNKPQCTHAHRCKNLLTLLYGSSGRSDESLLINFCGYAPVWDSSCYFDCSCLITFNAVRLTI